MSTRDWTTRASAAGAPVLFVVDADPQARTVTESALARRFGADYQVVTADVPSRSRRVGAAGRPRRPGGAAGGGPAPARHGRRGVPGAGSPAAPRREPGLLVAMDRYHTRIPFTELATLQRATALGRIDFSVVKGWVSPEEWLYPQVQEALSAWTMAHGPRHVVYRIVGEQWSSRSHTLRDVLTRNGVPFEFHPADSQSGRQLIRDFGIDVQRLPAAIRHDGSVLQDPGFAELAAAHGITTRPSSEVYDLAILGAGPAGLAAAVNGASEGLRTLVVEPWSIGGQAGSSSMIRNYLGFPRGIGGAQLAHRAWEQAVLFGAEFVFMQRGPGSGPRRPAADRLERGRQGSRAGGAHRGRCDLSPSGDPRPGPPGRDGGVLRRGGRRGPRYGRGGGLRGRRGQLRRSGCPAPGRVRRPCDTASARGLAGRRHVRLPHHATGGHPKHRGPTAYSGGRWSRRSPPGGPDGGGCPNRPAGTDQGHRRLRPDRRRAAHRLAS